MALLKIISFLDLNPLSHLILHRDRQNYLIGKKRDGFIFVSKSF